MFILIYNIGAIISALITPIWAYFYYRRLGSKLKLVDFVFFFILPFISWYWIYVMVCVFKTEDYFEVKTLGMPIVKVVI